MYICKPSNWSVGCRLNCNRWLHRHCEMSAAKYQGISKEFYNSSEMCMVAWMCRETRRNQRMKMHRIALHCIVAYVCWLYKMRSIDRRIEDVQQNAPNAMQCNAMHSTGTKHAWTVCSSVHSPQLRFKYFLLIFICREIKRDSMWHAKEFKHSPHNNSNNVLHKYLYLFNKNEQRKRNEKKCERRGAIHMYRYIETDDSLNKIAFPIVCLVYMCVRLIELAKCARAHTLPILTKKQRQNE